MIFKYLLLTIIKLKTISTSCSNNNQDLTKENQTNIAQSMHSYIDFDESKDEVFCDKLTCSKKNFLELLRTTDKLTEYISSISRNLYNTLEAYNYQKEKYKESIEFYTNLINDVDKCDKRPIEKRGECAYEILNIIKLYSNSKDILKKRDFIEYFCGDCLTNYLYSYSYNKIYSIQLVSSEYYVTGEANGIVNIRSISDNSIIKTFQSEYSSPIEKLIRVDSIKNYIITCSASEILKIDITKMLIYKTQLTKNSIGYSIDCGKLTYIFYEKLILINKSKVYFYTLTDNKPIRIIDNFNPEIFKIILPIDYNNVVTVRFDDRVMLVNFLMPQLFHGMYQGKTEHVIELAEVMTYDYDFKIIIAYSNGIVNVLQYPKINLLKNFLPCDGYLVKLISVIVKDVIGFSCSNGYVYIWNISNLKLIKKIPDFLEYSIKGILYDHSQKLMIISNWEIVLWT